MILKTAYLCNIGGRSTNDDTASIYQEAGKAWVYVGDGLGSYAGGKRASRQAGETLLAMVRKGGSMLSQEAMAQGAQAADNAVKRLQAQTQGNMKTTLVFLAVEGGQARWMHTGDSRLYHFRGGKLAEQTLDHSVSQMAVVLGEITPKEIRFHEDRNRVLRALGGENAKADISQLTPVQAGEDAFLLCSDGFWEYVYEEEMEAALSQAANPKEWLRQMEAILKTRTPKDNDNYTAAALICTVPGSKQPQKPQKSRWAFWKK